MQIQHIGYGIKGFYKITNLGYFWDMITDIVQYRLKVLKFWNTYGYEATKEAFGVSKRNLYSWETKLRDGGGDPSSLESKKPIPKRNANPFHPLSQCFHYWTDHS